MPLLFFVVSFTTPAAAFGAMVIATAAGPAAAANRKKRRRLSPFGLSMGLLHLVLGSGRPRLLNRKCFGLNGHEGFPEGTDRAIENRRLRFLQITEKQFRPLLHVGVKKSFLRGYVAVAGKFAGDDARHDLTERTNVVFWLLDVVAGFNATFHKVGSQYGQGLLVQKSGQ